jgi:hypothetical protein
MLQRLPGLVALTMTTVVAAQDDPAAFRSAIEQSLRAHPFFSRVSFTLVERPPFLFCVERAPNDAADHDVGVVNSFLPFLREVVAQFDEHYARPAGLVRRPEAGGYALAILSSAGRYVDFRTAIGNPSLASTRAHYTPALRLAVTYQDTFARHNTKGEERHALLHEFVHALQHAHSADGAMPKPVWFNEGLADYRASSTNVASSLREPPLHEPHVAALAYGYGHPGGRFFLAPIRELVAANSYADVVAAATKRNGAELPPDVVLSMFYAQAAMFVRFLHEAEQGKHRAGFVRYLQAAQRGESGVAAFLRAMAIDEAALAALESQWLAWLDPVLRQQYPTLRDLTKGEADATGALPMPPPSALDLGGLQWTADDLAERFAAVRRLCVAGEYEAALALLPGDAQLAEGERAFLQRERARVAGLVTLRDDALADVLNRKAQLAVTVNGAALRGKALRREGAAVVVQTGKTETTVPVTALTPAWLVVEGRRLKRFEGANRWLEVWTRWLKGDALQSMQGLLQLEYAAVKDLRIDLPRDLDASLGTAGAALDELLRLPISDDRELAAAALVRLQANVKAFGRTPTFERRKAAIERVARAYAERAFRADDAAALGIQGAVTRGDGGVMQVDYSPPSPAAVADFAPVPPKELEGVPAAPNKIAYTGASGLQVAPDGYRLIGSAWLRWPVALAGRQVVEIDYVIDADFVPDFGVALCATAGRMLLVMPTGGVQAFDPEGQFVDAVGGGAQLMAGATHKLRIEHDGKKSATVSIDGKVTATLGDVGRMKAGDVMLFVHSSTAVRIVRLRVAGVPTPTDPQQVRERYVLGVLRGLWP